MLTNIRVLIAACQELNIDFEFLHPNHNFVQIKINDNSYFFLNYATPFNSEVDASIFKDKGLTYQLLKDTVSIPYTVSFLSPFCKEKYRKYLEYQNIDSIVEEINRKFTLPVIIKMNFGSQGKNVFLCKNIEQVKLS
ncbi:MAG: alpha-L-glutamate ligase, partial [Symploca sp. SIO2C1]|nr:alpha-L-glutamate ligase [Symploca sp. SIO2C1]